MLFTPLSLNAVNFGFFLDPFRPCKLYANRSYIYTTSLYLCTMSKALTLQELHNLAMNHVGKDLESRGFEFVAINSKLKKHPQFVCIDTNSQYFFVIVKAVMLPDNPNNYDMIWMETFKKHAFEKEAKVLFAGVGLGNPNGDDLPVYLNEEYLIEYNGIQVLDQNMN